MNLVKKANGRIIAAVVFFALALWAASRMAAGPSTAAMLLGLFQVFVYLGLATMLLLQSRRDAKQQ